MQLGRTKWTEGLDPAVTGNSDAEVEKGWQKWWEARVTFLS